MKAEKIAYIVVTTILACLLFAAVCPKKIAHAPYRNASVLIVGDIWDIVYFDGQPFFTEHKKDRKESSIIKCRRRFEIGLLTKKEIDPECGI